MNDTEIIRKSYEQLIKQIFNAYWNDASIGNPPPNQVKQAEQNSKVGSPRREKRETGRLRCRLRDGERIVQRTPLHADATLPLTSPKPSR
jgi:hypothetical protein